MDKTNKKHWKELNAFADKLENHIKDTKDYNFFKKAIDTALDMELVSARDIAVEYAISYSNIEHWRNGSSAPHPTNRHIIFSWLKSRAVHKMRELERGKGEESVQKNNC